MKKQAGYGMPLMAGAALLGGAHMLSSGLNKAKQYKAGFNPGVDPQGVPMDPSYVMQKVAEVAPKIYNFIVKTAEEVKQSPFKDEITKELNGLMKKAMQMPPDLGHRLGNAALGIGAAAGASIAYSLAGDMYEALKRGITKGRDYRQMMRANPDLSEMPASDVQKAFSTLHRFNPEFASDPTVAGAFVRKNALYQEFDTRQLSDLVTSRKNLADIKKLSPVPKIPWDDRETKNLQKEKLRQETDPDFQREMRRPDQGQSDLWDAQRRKAEMDIANMQFRPGGGGSPLGPNYSPRRKKP